LAKLGQLRSEGAKRGGKDDWKRRIGKISWIKKRETMGRGDIKNLMMLVLAGTRRTLSLRGTAILKQEAGSEIPDRAAKEELQKDLDVVRTPWQGEGEGEAQHKRKRKPEGTRRRRFSAAAGEGKKRQRRSPKLFAQLQKGSKRKQQLRWTHHRTAGSGR